MILQRVGFAKIHVFPYSQRAGTKAAQMPGQLSNAEKERRARELIALGETIGRQYRERGSSDTRWRCCWRSRHGRGVGRLGPASICA